MLGFFRADEDAFVKELMSSNINIDKLKKYIANGVNINGVDEKGRNYLFFFAAKKKFYCDESFDKPRYRYVQRG